MTEPYFDRLAAKYRCCCGCMHVETGTKIICGLALIGYLISIINFFASGESGKAWGNWDLLRIVIGLFVVVLPFVGMKRNNPCYFIPYLCTIALSTVVFVAAIPCMALAFYPYKYTIGQKFREFIEKIFKGESHTSEETDAMIAFVMVLTFILVLFNTWIFSVVYKCYKYVSDKKAAGYHEMTIPQSANVY